jgi:hypothetical protein
MNKIISATIIDGYAMLIVFADGKKVVYDFSKFEGDVWFDRVKCRFANFAIDIAGLWWGDDAVSPIEIYKTGIELSKIQAAA